MIGSEDIPAEILNALLSSMFEISPIAMSITSSNGKDSRYLRVNQAHLQLVGREWSELQGVRVAQTVVREDEARARRHRRLAEEGGYVGEYVEIKHADGRMVPTLISAQRSIINDVQYDVEIIVDISTRIDEQRAHEERLAQLARTDVVTDLQNRLAFEERLAELTESREDGRQPTLALLDLDGFKKINDEHGHDAGDAVLHMVAQRIAQTLREGDFVSRIGGDEFAILYNPSSGSVPASRFDAIAQAVREPMEIDGKLIAVGVSIGSAQLAPGENAADLFRRADGQMYDAKKRQSAGARR
ncbi:MAG: diguanylate cyclase [Phyllobacteriaceae bacterium]|nr:diguanylate cyclase [Phyllobacteriaceae bacterium]